MTPAEIRLRIMSQTTEDLAGQWELPATPGTPDLNALIAALADLIQGNLVTIHRGPGFASEAVALPPASAQRAM